MFKLAVNKIHTLKRFSSLTRPSLQKASETETAEDLYKQMGISVDSSSTKIEITSHKDDVI